ncbi:MAG TPA: acyloxyacyl hydrolase [Pyrinomonadaceae bacterium]|nr:acyloxyacyl hydrolase [Pyrinomonadaceae bacterium]
MKPYSKVISVVLFVIAVSLSSYAQTDAPVAVETDASRTPLTTPHPDSSDDKPYRLRRGLNEFGFLGGVSFAATTIFGGLHDDEAADRKFILAELRYGRPLATNDSVALQYTFEGVPLAIATGTIVARSTVGGVTTFQRETAYGAGLTPLGLQLDMANSSKIHPFVHVNGGFLYFNKAVPIEDSGQFAYVAQGGAGVRIFTSSRRAVTLGVKLHHISNGNREGSNRGLNQFVIYAGFSIFR